MPTFHQYIAWKEDDHGSVKATVVISNTYDELFVDLTEESTEITCLIIDETSKSIKSRHGGNEIRELKLIINEALSNPQDEDAISFIKAVEESYINRFIAVFIDTDSESPSPDDMLFNGVFQHNIEADDLLWKNEHYDTDIKPKRLLRFIAKSYDDAVLSQFTMYDLVFGNESQNVPGIDSTWEDENVKDRIAQFWHEDGSNYETAYIDKLVNLNDLLRKLADNLETAIDNNNLGNISIKFDSASITGWWHPVKWKWQHNGVRPLYKLKEPTRFDASYDVLTNYHKQLRIKPDERPETLAENELGQHDNFETYMYYLTSPWVSYRRVKFYEDEPDAAQWKDFRYSNYKTFFEFLSEIALEFGMFVSSYWATTTELRISFKARNLDNSNEISIKTAEKAQIKPTSSTVNSIADKYTERGRRSNILANYYAIEGGDIYEKTMQAGELLYRSSAAYDAVKEPQIQLFSISPTIVRSSLLPWFLHEITTTRPHNYKQIQNGNIISDSKWENCYGLTTAIYIYQSNSLGDDAANMPDYFWGPVGGVSCKINGIDHLSYTMNDFYRALGGLELATTLYEYLLDVPFIYCAKLNDDISWRHLQLLNTIKLDNTYYVIVEIKIDLKNVKVRLCLQSTSRFTFQEIDYTNQYIVEDYTIPEPTEPTDTNDPTKLFVGEAIQDIAHLDFVAQLGDGTLVKAVPREELYHQLLGFANVDDDGVLRYIRTSGVLTDSNLPDYPINTLLHLRYEPTDNNFSDTGLTVSNNNENMICIIAKYIGEKTILISEGFQDRYCLAPHTET